MTRQGAVLVEVIVAMAILSITGVATIQFLATLQRAQGRLNTRELEWRQADQLLTSTVLLTGQELDQRLGVRRAGKFLVWIDRPEPSLFRISLSTARAPELELLATLIYRPDVQADER